MPRISDKENIQPYHPSFATKAAKAAVKRSTTPTPNQIDKVVESVANATKRLSQHSNQSSSSKRKVENRVGPWRLGRTLGKGSTGRVRLAKHTVTGQLAAIKIVPKTILDFNNSENSNNNNQNNQNKNKKKKQKTDENGLPYGIEREIIIMKLISHPNIMALYDVWENKNELYLVLEYVEGGELFDFLINHGKLSEKDAVKYFRMIINGVSYCHKFNICHRDLKPENILLDKNGKIKIADFGMAALETQQKLLETSCGSPHYASPEIVAGKNYHGSPSDVWSCGVILFALLTGHLPFDDPNIRQLLLKVQTGKFHMPSNLSNEAKDLIWSMLRINPNERIKIENIINHPLMLKYPDESNDKVEDKLDKLDISKPVIDIDYDILNNLQTLWHGIPQNHIIKMLQNNEKNSEKMFYYLLENYKLTHSNSNETPNLTKSISKTTLNSNKTSNSTIPRSTSRIITTIQDENGNILKSETQKLKPTRSPLKSKNLNVTHNNNRSQIIASTSFNKSISFQRLKRDATTSTLSIVNMKRNLSINPDSSMLDIKDKAKLNNDFKYPALIKNNNNNNNNFDDDEIAELSAIIDNSDVSQKRELTVNPKDLPELPDLRDYKYLMKTIFADNDSTPTKNKTYPNTNNSNITTATTTTTTTNNNNTHSKSTKNNTIDTNVEDLKMENYKNHKDSGVIKTRVDNDMILLDIDDSTFSNDDLSSNTSLITSNYTSSLDPRNNSYLKHDKSLKSIPSPNNNKIFKNNELISINTNDSLPNEKQISKLEMLKKELSINNPAVHRNFSGLKSIKSSSTRRLNSFLQDEYKSVKVDDYNLKHNDLPSISFSHKPENSIDSKCLSHDDTCYSLHSAVEIRLMTPTEEDLRQLGDGKVFEDADESLINKKLISDSNIKNNITVHRNILPNIDFQKNNDIRNSLISDSTNDELSQKQTNDKNSKWRNSSELSKIETNQQDNSKNINVDVKQDDINNSDFDDAEEFPMPQLPILNGNKADETFDSDITGSMYTTVEEQPQSTTKEIKSEINQSNEPKIESLKKIPISKNQQRPFSELKSGARISMTPTTDTTSSALPDSLRIFTPKKENESIKKVNLSPIDAIPRSKEIGNTSEVKPPEKHAYRTYVTEKQETPVLPPRVINAEKINYNKSKASQSENAVPTIKKNKHSNWFKKMFSAFSKKPSNNNKNNGANNTSFSYSKPSQSKNTSKFSFKFNKTRFMAPKNKVNDLSFSEHWLESDIITRDKLIDAIKKDPKTKLLKFTDIQKTSNGCNYTIEVTNLKTVIRAEIVDKVGAEYGFGGCYMKFIKLKGTKDSFNYWCGVIRDIVASLEKKEEEAQ